MVVNSEQIQFHQKGRVEAKEGPLSQTRALICVEGMSPILNSRRSPGAYLIFLADHGWA